MQCEYGSKSCKILNGGMSKVKFNNKAWTGWGTGEWLSFLIVYGSLLEDRGMVGRLSENVIKRNEEYLKARGGREYMNVVIKEYKEGEFLPCSFP